MIDLPHLSDLQEATINFCNQTIRVLYKTNNCIGWIQHYIPIEKNKPQIISFTVAQRVDPIVFYKLLSLTSSTDSAPTVKVFKDVFYKYQVIGGNGVEIFYEFPILFFIMKEAENQFSVVTPAPNNQDGRLLLRIAREVAYRRCVSTGMTSFHAGAVASQDKGVILLGESGAGKTTLLIGLIKKLGWDFICNDRTIIDLTNTRLYGLPLPIRIGFGTLIGDADLASGCLAMGKLSRGQVPEKEWRSIESSRTHEWGSRKKLELSPKELIDITKGRIIESARITCVIIPRMTQKETLLKITSLNMVEALELITPQCTSPEDPLWPQTWLEHLKPLPYSAKESLIYFTQRIPFYLVEYGIDSSFDEAIDRIEEIVKGLPS
ncbi:hypothetical protein HCU66_26305 [Pseudomonas frederiksbergensis]|uniref:hypothetical protein n=1 Tax=Pseudomonas frederiksbergensis TaxID=104087 RepID=UPI001981C1D5|nr:hypothetical protein [Pseudomonas frederiksbergensis]MBN3865707.1 hypothetical protein [Pseudomonas frederiksbergensis]